MDLKNIRDDLKEIRHFYQMKDVITSSITTIEPTKALKTVEKYNNAIKNAPASLYVLYVSLYVKNNTQAALAEKWCYTNDYIKQLNRKLCEFLLDEFNDKCVSTL